MKELFKLYKEYGCSVFLVATLIVFAILAAVYTAFGFCFMYMFNWLMPVFWADAPQLTLLQSIGTVIFLIVIGSFFKNSSSNE